MPGGAAGGARSDSDHILGGGGDLTLATWQSVNTFYIQLEEQVGILNVAAMARTLGIPAARLAKVGPNDGSLTLGTEVVSPLDMATAYATLAARGLRCDPRPVTSITSPTGQPVAYTRPGRCRQVIDPAVADTVTSVLEGVLTNGTGYPNAATIGRPAAGKTGTNEGFSSAWFVGYTPQLSAAVELGDPRGGPTHPLTSIAHRRPELHPRVRRRHPSTDLGPDHAHRTRRPALRRATRPCTRNRLILTECASGEAAPDPACQ